MKHPIDSSRWTAKALTRRTLTPLFVLAMFAAGCRTLGPGDPQLLAKPHPPRVILIRGWQDLYSKGIDQLGTEIAARGITTEIFRPNQWRDVARSLMKLGNTEPLTLIGFSYGADDVILIAGELQKEHRPVDLLITIDPVEPKPVPENVRRCFNYFQSNGLWDFFPWFRGVPLKSDGPRIYNLNLRVDRKKLLQPDTSHKTIAANPLLHREIIQRMLESLHRSS